jgi:hypothetical protein
VEQQYLGMASSTFLQFIGMVVNQWSLNMQPQARILQTFAMMGARVATPVDATIGDGSPLLPSARTICNTTGNIGTLIWDGSAFSRNVLSFQMTLNNNLRTRPALSREITLEHGKGRCEPDGTLTTYFEDRAELESFIEHETARLLLPIRDPAGNLFSIYIPQMEFPSGFPTIPGVNSDVVLPLTFNATASEEAGFTIQVDQLDLEESGSPS